MTAALGEAGVTRGAGVVLADEMRLGLRGQVRRVLAPRGVKVGQRLQLRYQWSSLLLAVDPRAATLRWRWLARCRAQPIRDVLAAWAPDAVVWDGHGAHTAKLLAALPLARVRLPPVQPRAEPGRTGLRGGAPARRGARLPLRRRQAGSRRSVSDGAGGRSCPHSQPLRLGLAHRRPRRPPRPMTATFKADWYQPSPCATC